MFIIFDDNRLSDSPFIERVWRCHSESEGLFVSVATSHRDLVVTGLQGQLTVTLKGPETKKFRWAGCGPARFANRRERWRTNRKQAAAAAPSAGC